ncbi:MAG: tetratricopeptide repeat protein [Ilumatobacteraceae bacterium]
MTMTLAATVDAHGNPMTGDRATVESYDRAIDRLVRFHPDVVEQASDLSSADEPAPMATALFAYLHLMSTDVDDVETARTLRDSLAVAALNEREQMHAAAVGAWADGDWVRAAQTLDELLYRWPMDVTALMFGHQLDFFLGDAQNLRDRAIRSLRNFDPQHPHVEYVRGMAAFGLEESGHYGQALEAGRRAVEANTDDVWATHAVAHTYEMQGMVDEGIRFMTSTADNWGAGNLFTVHNWWHLALYHLEAGQPERSLAIYDAQLHNTGSLGVPIEMLDGSALLWRLYLDGLDTGGRFEPLADAWAPKTGQPWYAFNDVHAVMAFAGAGRLADAHQVVRQLGGWVETAGGTNARMTAEIGLPACRAIVAYVEDRHADVVAELMPIRRVFQHFGGSHAQRDALQRTLLESALRSGRYDLASALTAERLGIRETSVYAWTQRARALRGAGQEAAAAEAATTAAANQARFAAATPAVA